MVCGGCGWEVAASPPSPCSFPARPRRPSPQTCYPWHAAHSRLCSVVLLQILLNKHLNGQILSRVINKSIMSVRKQSLTFSCGGKETLGYSVFKQQTNFWPATLRLALAMKMTQLSTGSFLQRTSSGSKSHSTFHPHRLSVATSHSGGLAEHSPRVIDIHQSLIQF